MDSSNIENDINKQNLDSTQSLDGIKTFFPFLYKLHMITNKSNHPFVVWSDCGQKLQFDYMGMQDYLMSKSSIFHEKSVAQFVNRLRKFKFTKCAKDMSEEAELDPPKVWLYYKHPNFQRDHNELIEKIKGANEIYDYVPLKSPTKKDMYEHCIGEPSNSHHIRKRGRGDLCSKMTDTMSRMEQTRIRMHLQLRFQREQGVLLQQVTDADTVSVKKVEQKGSRIVTRVTNEPIVKLPGYKFESPLETNLPVQNSINPELAGFYGITDFVKIKDFFGEYLPRRDNDTVVIKVPELEIPPDNEEMKDQVSGADKIVEEEELVGSDLFFDADDDFIVNSSPGNDFNNVTISETSKSSALDSPNTVNNSVDDEIQNALNTLCGDQEEKTHDETNVMDLFGESVEKSVKRIKLEVEAVKAGIEISQIDESNSFGDYFAQIDENAENIEEMEFDFDLLKENLFHK